MRYCLTGALTPIALAPLLTHNILQSWGPWGHMAVWQYGTVRHGLFRHWGNLGWPYFHEKDIYSYNSNIVIHMRYHSVGTQQICHKDSGWWCWFAHNQEDSSGLVSFLSAWIYNYKLQFINLFHYNFQVSEGINENLS